MASLGPTIQEIWMRNQQLQQQQQRADAQFAFEQQKHKDDMLLKAMGQDASNRQYETPEQRLKRELAVTEAKGKWGVAQREENDDEVTATLAQRDRASGMPLKRETFRAGFDPETGKPREGNAAWEYRDHPVAGGSGGGSGSLAAMKAKYAGFEKIIPGLFGLSGKAASSLQIQIARQYGGIAKMAVIGSHIYQELLEGALDYADPKVAKFWEDAEAVLGGGSSAPTPTAGSTNPYK